MYTEEVRLGSMMGRIWILSKRGNGSSGAGAGADVQLSWLLRGTRGRSPLRVSVCTYSELHVVACGCKIQISACQANRIM